MYFGVGVGVGIFSLPYQFNGKAKCLQGLMALMTRSYSK